MASRDTTLLGEIERDLLDGKPLADLLRKCVVLGGRLGSGEMREWASRELRGYESRDDLPAYRKVPAQIVLDAVTGFTQITGQIISPMSLPDFASEKISDVLPVAHGVGELEALVRSRQESGAVAFALPMAAELAAYMNSQSGDDLQQITSLYWRTSTATISGVLDQIRTTLAELVGELRAAMPDDQHVPTAEQARQAVNVAVNGRRSRVTVTAAQADHGSQSTVIPSTHSAARGFWTLGRKIGAAVVGLATIVGAVIAVVQWIG